MGKEDAELIRRFGKAISVLSREDQKYMLGRVEAMADAVKDSSKVSKNEKQ